MNKDMDYLMSMTTDPAPHTTREDGMNTPTRFLDEKGWIAYNTATKAMGLVGRPSCGVHYAHGLVERWCDRRVRHRGPHSGNVDGLRCRTNSRAAYDYNIKN